MLSTATPSPEYLLPDAELVCPRKLVPKTYGQHPRDHERMSIHLAQTNTKPPNEAPSKPRPTRGQNADPGDEVTLETCFGSNYDTELFVSLHLQEEPGVLLGSGGSNLARPDK